MKSSTESSTSSTSSSSKAALLSAKLVSLTKPFFKNRRTLLVLLILFTIIPLILLISSSWNFSDYYVYYSSNSNNNNHHRDREHNQHQRDGTTADDNFFAARSQIINPDKESFESLLLLGLLSDEENNKLVVQETREEIQERQQQKVCEQDQTSESYCGYQNGIAISPKDELLFACPDHSVLGDFAHCSPVEDFSHLPKMPTRAPSSSSKKHRKHRKKNVETTTSTTTTTTTEAPTSTTTIEKSSSGDGEGNTETPFSLFKPTQKRPQFRSEEDIEELIELHRQRSTEYTVNVSVTNLLARWGPRRIPAWRRNVRAGNISKLPSGYAACRVIASHEETKRNLVAEEDYNYLLPKDQQQSDLPTKPPKASNLSPFQISRIQFHFTNELLLLLRRKQKRDGDGDEDKDQKNKKVFQSDLPKLRSFGPFQCQMPSVVTVAWTPTILSKVHGRNHIVLRIEGDDPKLIKEKEKLEKMKKISSSSLSARLPSDEKIMEDIDDNRLVAAKNKKRKGGTTSDDINSVLMREEEMKIALERSKKNKMCRISVQAFSIRETSLCSQARLIPNFFPPKMYPAEPRSKDATEILTYSIEAAGLSSLDLFVASPSPCVNVSSSTSSSSSSRFCPFNRIPNDLTLLRGLEEAEKIKKSIITPTSTTTTTTTNLEDNKKNEDDNDNNQNENNGTKSSKTTSSETSSTRQKSQQQQQQKSTRERKRRSSSSLIALSSPESISLSKAAAFRCDTGTYMGFTNIVQSFVTCAMLASICNRPILEYPLKLHHGVFTDIFDLTTLQRKIKETMHLTVRFVGPSSLNHGIRVDRFLHHSHAMPGHPKYLDGLVRTCNARPWSTIFIGDPWPTRINIAAADFHVKFINEILVPSKRIKAFSKKIVKVMQLSVSSSSSKADNNENSNDDAAKTTNVVDEEDSVLKGGIGWIAVHLRFEDDAISITNTNKGKGSSSRRSSSSSSSSSTVTSSAIVRARRLRNFIDDAWPNSRVFYASGGLAPEISAEFPLLSFRKQRLAAIKKQVEKEVAVKNRKKKTTTATTTSSRNPFHSLFQSGYADEEDVEEEEDNIPSWVNKDDCFSHAIPRSSSTISNKNNNNNNHNQKYLKEKEQQEREQKLLLEKLPWKQKYQGIYFKGESINITNATGSAVDISVLINAPIAVVAEFSSFGEIVAAARCAKGKRVFMYDVDAVVFEADCNSPILFRRTLHEQIRASEKSLRNSFSDSRSEFTNIVEKTVRKQQQRDGVLEKLLKQRVMKFKRRFNHQEKSDDNNIDEDDDDLTVGYQEEDDHRKVDENED